jgi:hypothetical protein
MLVTQDPNRPIREADIAGGPLSADTPALQQATRIERRCKQKAMSSP